MDKILVREQVFPKMRLFEVDIGSIDDVSVRQSSLQRIFNYGMVTLVIKTRIIRLGHISNPKDFRKYVIERVNLLREGPLAGRKTKPLQNDIVNTLTWKSKCPICENMLLKTKSLSELLVCPNCETVFHRKCLQDWLEKKGSCQHCSTRLSPLEKIETDGLKLKRASVAHEYM